MATTYVQLTREEFEEWLDTLSKPWHLKPGKVGIYVVKMSDRVAIEISSSMTGRDDVVSRAQASMGVRLVSLITGHTLNKKAQEQSHVKRTINWRDNLRKVYERMVDAYRRSESFYEALAPIQDRDQYKVDVLKKIEGIAGWEANNFLADLHGRVSTGGILTDRQMEALDRAAQPPPTVNLLDRLPRLRALWAVAKQHGDTAAMKAAEAAASLVKDGRDLDDRDAAQMRTFMTQYQTEIRNWLATKGERPGRVAALWMSAGIVLQPENATERYHTRIPREKGEYWSMEVTTHPLDDGRVQVGMTGTGAFGGSRIVLPPREGRTGDQAWLRSQFWAVVDFMEHLQDTVHKDDVAFQHWTVRALDRTPGGSGGVRWQATVPVPRAGRA